MFQTYEEALQWIHSRLRLGMKPGLTRMNQMMEKLDFPEKKIKTVHIGGTNGKGSTVTYLRCILERSGLQVGTFTSPYLEQFNERISVNGVPIKDEEILELANKLYPIVAEMDEVDELGGPTEFEIITAMSFYYFAYIHKVDVVLYEVGLGGRFDSTNIISPLLSIITSIGLDHIAILGETYEEIAFEKAGIIKKNTPIIAAVKHGGAKEVIINRAKEENAPIYLWNKHFESLTMPGHSKGEYFTFRSAGYQMSTSINMMGEHQIENASLAIQASLLLKTDRFPTITEQTIHEGLKNAIWPGRFEIISEQPLIVVDGAHNEEGVEALVEVLKNRYENKRKSIVFAALKDKKTDKMINKLDSIAHDITFVSFDFPRAASGFDLYQESNHEHKSYTDNWEETIDKKIEEISDDELLVITGSLYFLSNVKNYWKNKDF